LLSDLQPDCFRADLLHNALHYAIDARLSALTCSFATDTANLRQQNVNRAKKTASSVCLYLFFFYNLIVLEYVTKKNEKKLCELIDGIRKCVISAA
jgi:hypothetical protein